MSDTFSVSDDGPLEDSLLDSFATNGPALLEPSNDSTTETVEWTGARCEKCNASLESDVVSICRRCGWYGSLNAYVELDPSWETASEPETTTAEKPQLSHL